MFPDDLTRVTVLAGHYGSGKTTLAANIALRLCQTRKNVTLCDLDIVNPYFRTSNHREMLEGAGVRLISSPLAGSCVESPGFPPQAAAVFDDESITAVIDVGGDDRGALALGRYAGKLKDASILLIVNMYRPLSSNAEDTVSVCRAIEHAGRFSFTGIINNSNLGEETTIEDIYASYPYAREISKALNLPVVATSSIDFQPSIYKKWVLS
jgi:MinD-like ATPase involved in chromosome partitioning or flagellar assembly